MRERTDSSRLRALAFLASVLGAIVAAVVLSAGAQAQNLDDVRSQLDSAEAELGQQRDQAGVLTSEISRYSDQISQLSAQVAELRNEEAILAERLAEVQARLDAEEAKLERLRERLAVARAELRERLVEIYKTDEPDALTVILDSEGYDDMMQRYDYISRISDQDQAIFTRVEDLRNQTADTVERIEAAREEIETQKAELEATRVDLQSQEAALDEARAAKAAALDNVESDIGRLEGDVSSIQGEIEARLQARQERQEAAEAAAAAAAAAEAAEAEEAAEAAEAEESAPAPAPEPEVPTGPVPEESSSGMIWPVSGSVVSPFGMRWGRMHEGIDIAAPSGTPIKAAASGTVALAEPTSGYGNYTCIDHGDGLSTCYAHQSSYVAGTGDSVSQGEVIGYVGCTGTCYGDHLHFEVRVDGSAQDPMGYL